MKHTLLVTALCALLAGMSNAQELSSNELVDLYYESIIESNDYLMKKGWVFDQSKKYKKASEVAWSFNDVNSGLILAYISLLDPDDGKKAIVYTTFSFSLFNQLRETLKEIPIVESGVEANKLFTVYEDEKHTYRLEISCEKMLSENIYTISLVENPDFDPSPRD